MNVMYFSSSGTETSWIKLPSKMFTEQNQKHLKPLSKYAQGVLNDSVAHAGIHHFIQPPNDLRNDITKTSMMACDETTEASSRRPSIPQTLCESQSLSEDPGACEGRRSVGSVMDYAGAHNVAQSFDLDIDDLLSLSPCGNCSQRVRDREKNRNLDISSSSLHQRKYWQHSAAPVDLDGPNVTTVNRDWSSWDSYTTEDHLGPRNLSVPANQRPPRAPWSQLLLDCRDVEGGSLAAGFQTAVTEPRQHSSVLDLKVIMSGRPSSELARAPSRGSVDDLRRVGLTMLREDTMESPLQVKASRLQKHLQLCAFCSTCSQTTCLFFFHIC